MQKHSEDFIRNNVSSLHTHQLVCWLTARKVEIKFLDIVVSKYLNFDLSQGVNYINLLEDLSKEQKFDVTYVDIEDKTEDGETQCLVQESCF